MPSDLVTCHSPATFIPAEPDLGPVLPRARLCKEAAGKQEQQLRCVPHRALPRASQKEGNEIYLHPWSLSCAPKLLHHTESPKGGRNFQTGFQSAEVPSEVCRADVSRWSPGSRPLCQWLGIQEELALPSRVLPRTKPSLAGTLATFSQSPGACRP